MLAVVGYIQSYGCWLYSEYTAFAGWPTNLICRENCESLLIADAASDHCHWFEATRNVSRGSFACPGWPNIAPSKVVPGVVKWTSMNWTMPHWLTINRDRLTRSHKGPIQRIQYKQPITISQKWLMGNLYRGNPSFDHEFNEEWQLCGAVFCFFESTRTFVDIYYWLHSSRLIIYRLFMSHPVTSNSWMACASAVPCKECGRKSCGVWTITFEGAPWLRPYMSSSTSTGDDWSQVPHSCVNDFGNQHWSKSMELVCQLVC